VQRRLAISFSGGETSAYMTWLILSKYRHLYDVIVILFMNTSRENEACLEFVDRCDRLLFRPLGQGVIWLEAVTHHNERRKCSARVVTYETACRDGSVYEDMIRKYGIPNKSYPHCNRELKLSPFTSFLELCGWSIGSYDTAIGIRADEIDRMVKGHKEKRIVYPLIQWEPTTKRQINGWFRDQPFRLDQPGYRGNCKDCWKKSFRKLYTIANETPEDFDFSLRMEALYGYLRGVKRVFFRENKPAYQILHEARTLKFEPATDDAQVYDPELDVGGACDGGESCELFSQDDAPDSAPEP
jgi:hypothetical protein